MPSLTLRSLAAAGGSALVLASLLAPPAAEAQQRIRGATATAPSAAVRAAQAAPSPSGLRPPLPAGLSAGSGAAVAGDPIAANAPVVGPGVGGNPAGSPAAAGVVPGRAGAGVATPTLLPGAGNFAAVPGSAEAAAGLPGNGSTGFYGAVITQPDGAVRYPGDPAPATAPATAVLGAPGYGFVRGPRQTVPQGGLGFNAVDVARSFLSADANGDGELSRAEAQRLALAGASFEEMDRNFDGVVTRGEYEDGLR